MATERKLLILNIFDYTDLGLNNYNMHCPIDSYLWQWDIYDRKQLVTISSKLANHMDASFLVSSFVLPVNLVVVTTLEFGGVN